MAAKTVYDDFELDAATQRALLRMDFATFVRAVFTELNPNGKLIWDEYLDVLCSHLQGLVLGDTRRQIVAMPPRHLKSICGSVALSAFFLGHFPDKNMMVVCYGKDLSRELAQATQRVMQSDWYQAAFGTRLTSTRQALERLRTTAGGSRHATSIDGAATGFGADLLIFDDPQKAGDVHSEALRTNANRAFSETFLSRRNNPADCRILVIQQRFHEDDFIGHVTGLSQDWNQLILPAIAEEDEAHLYRNWINEDCIWRRKAGEVLHPGRIGSEELNEIRLTSGEAVWAAQYQQRPTPAGGGIVQIDWFQRYAERPIKFDRIIQSWDAASKTNERNDFSACVTVGVIGKSYYVLDVFRERLEYHQLKAKVLDHARLFDASIVLIEDAAAGMALLQELANSGFSKARACKPDRAKAVRMEGQTGYIRSGFVHLPEQAHWLAEYLHELEVFPKGRFDDQVDATSQALEYLSNHRMEFQGLYDFYRLEAERLEEEAQRPIYFKQANPGVHLIDIEGHTIRPDENGIFRVPRKSAGGLNELQGWHRLSPTEILNLVG